MRQEPIFSSREKRREKKLEKKSPDTKITETVMDIVQNCQEEVDESATSRKKSTALPREVPVTQIHPIRSIQAQPVQPGNTTLNATGTNATLGCMTPFSVEIMNNPNPGKIKVPLIDHFTGSTDPEDHLAAYKAQMSVQTGCETHLV